MKPVFQRDPRRARIRDVAIKMEALEPRLLLSAVSPASGGAESRAMGLVGAAGLVMQGFAGHADTDAPLATTTTVFAVENAVVGMPTTLWAAVHVQQPTNYVGQSVSFYVDGKIIGTAPMSNTAYGQGSAKLNASFTTVGSHQVTASFGGLVGVLGQLDIAASSSDPLMINCIDVPDSTTPVTLQVIINQSHTDLSKINPYPDGFGVTLGNQRANPAAVTVYVFSDQILPIAGTIDLYDGDTLLGTQEVQAVDHSAYGNAPLNSDENLDRSAAIFGLNIPGDHLLRAVYSGDVSHQGTQVTLDAKLGGEAYGVALTGPGQATLGDPVVLSVTVMHLPNTIGDAMARGSVTLLDQGQAIGTATLDSSGHASFSVPDPSVGGHYFTATYVDAAGLTGSTDSSASRNGVTTQVVAADSNQRYVLRLYRDLLGRTGDTAGVLYWVGRMDAPTMSSGGAGDGDSSAAADERQMVVEDILASDEYRTALIGSYYRAILHRDGNSAEIAGWVAAMDAGLGSDAARDAFLASDEAYAQAGGTADGFIGRVYQALLSRDAESSGVAVWSDALAHGASRIDVIHAVRESQEYRGDAVNGYYARYLNRRPDDGGAACWCDLLRRASEVQVLASLLGSPEYFDDSLSAS